MKKIPIKLNTSNALRSLGSLYRSPADAIKEHISNALDEHVRARAAGTAAARCEVSLRIQKSKVTIDYPYGMSPDEFRDALQRVADSAKKHLDMRLIGQLGIGMFSFMQIGRKCVFISKKGKGYERVKVTLREGSDDAEFETPRKREGLDGAGIHIEIGNLLFDPTKPRGPLAPARLERVFADKFDKFLRDGTLDIRIISGGKVHKVKPRRIKLPPIGEAYREWRLSDSPEKLFGLELYYDPSGKGRVSIRHMGVMIVEDLKAIDAYGLESSVYAGGNVKGFIDGDFLAPLPARTGFEENEDWVAFLAELDRLRPAIEAEVETHRREEAAAKLAELQKKAIELARDILDTDEFGDLELLDGLGRKSRAPRLPENGFSFSPASLRIEEGKRRRLTFRALVPGRVPDGSEVAFTSSAPDVVTVETAGAVLRAADANKLGVVKVAVKVAARKTHPEPVTVTAACGDLTAFARIRVRSFRLERETLSGSHGTGKGINYAEVPFEDGSEHHSRYVSRVVEINDLNEDYKREVLEGDRKAALAYAALLIGKETIAFNDKSGTVDGYLEKLITFMFRLRERVEKRPPRRRK
jgi:hypothetical protein